MVLITMNLTSVASVNAILNRHSMNGCIPISDTKQTMTIWLAAGSTMRVIL